MLVPAASASARVATIDEPTAVMTMIVSETPVRSPEIVPAEAFGGAEPSTIVDAGQYVRESDRAAKSVDLMTGDPERKAKNLAELRRAVACIDEAMKWIPEQEEGVPPDAFFTDDGRAFAALEPLRFRRSRLDALRAAYQEKLAELRGDLLR